MRCSGCLQFVLLLYAGSWTTKEGFWQVLAFRLCHSSTCQAQDCLTEPNHLTAGCLMWHIILHKRSTCPLWQLIQEAGVRGHASKLSAITSTGLAPNCSAEVWLGAAGASCGIEEVPGFTASEAARLNFST